MGSERRHRQLHLPVWLAALGFLPSSPQPMHHSMKQPTLTSSTTTRSTMLKQPLLRWITILCQAQRQHGHLIINMLNIGQLGQPVHHATNSLCKHAKQLKVVPRRQQCFSRLNLHGGPMGGFLGMPRRCIVPVSGKHRPDGACVGFPLASESASKQILTTCCTCCDNGNHAETQS